MQTVIIEGQLRKDTGKKASRDLRQQGMVPAVIYGGDENVHFYAPILAFRSIVYTPDFKRAEIQVDGKSYPCLLKDLQFDAVTDDLIHVDFQEMKTDRKIIANIPIKFTGRSAGVQKGGVFLTKMKYVKIRTYPKYLEEHLEVDVTDMQLHDNIRVEDLEKENLEILTAARQPIASIVPTRVLKQMASGGASDEATAEGEETAAVAGEKGTSTEATKEEAAAPKE